MNVAVVVIGILATIAVSAWFFLNRKNPESAATHEEIDERSDDRVERQDDDPGRNRPGPGA